MRPIRTIAVLFAAATLLLACGDDPVANDTTSTTTTTATTTSVPTTSTTPAALEEPAVWPAADVVFSTPEEAAEDFVSSALGVPPVLGEFQQGDTRSGETEVFSPGEDGSGTTIVRSRLLLRQLGPDDGWFVLGAVNDNASVGAPPESTEVEAGLITVEGMARGFEGAVVVTAMRAGSAEPLDQAVTQAGAMETPEPYSVELDLSDAEAGDTITLLVRGGTGLEDDPGDFGAMAVTIAG